MPCEMGARSVSIFTMPMKQCGECNSTYNDAMADECPICKDRREKASQDSKLASALSTDTSEDTLGKLAMDDDPDVRAAAVANPNTPQWAKNRASKEQSQSIDTVDAPAPVGVAKASALVGASASNDQSAQVLQEMRKQTAELVKIRDATRTTRNFVVAGAIAFGTFFLFGGFIGLLALGS